MIFVFVYYHGFQSGGSGATIPSLAIHNKDFSVSGSIPINCAYSWTSVKQKKEQIYPVLLVIHILSKLMYKIYQKNHMNYKLP